MKVADIRKLFAEEYLNENFTIDKTGEKTIEILGASFLADDDSIFGKPNQDYIAKELLWYFSKSRDITDIYGDSSNPPMAWEYAADKNGMINSNYGYLIYSKDYHSQYSKVLRELETNPDSRRAIMIYTRPEIWNEYNIDGMSDFICTNAVSYYIRNKKLHCVVQMRSNDSWAGYRNDYAWQQWVFNELAESLGCDAGNMQWQVQNLHVYEKNFYLLDHYVKTGEHHITKKDYDELYA